MRSQRLEYEKAFSIAFESESYRIYEPELGRVQVQEVKVFYLYLKMRLYLYLPLYVFVLEKVRKL